MTMNTFHSCPVSVVMPTYKRPRMLRRAVDSVLRQTFTDWELVISDDEDPPGEAWRYLESLSSGDSRIRIYRNPGAHGQIGNNNFVLSQAKGRWIKPLYDDDAMKPGCLDRFVQIVEGLDHVSLVCCLADNYVNDRLAKPARRGRLKQVERLDTTAAMEATYLQEIEIGTPVQCLFPAAMIHDHRILWTDPGDMHSGFDTWWLYRIMAKGDLLLINEPLVDQHWGHETGTLEMQNHPERLDADIIRLHELLRALIPSGRKLPPPCVTRQQIYLMRAVLRLRDRRWCDVLKLISRCPDPRAWWLAFRWLMNKSCPGRMIRVRRQVIHPAIR